MPMLYILATISLIQIIFCLSRLDRNYKKIQKLSEQLDRLEGMLWNLSQGMETRKQNAPDAKAAAQAHAAPEKQPAPPSEPEVRIQTPGSEKTVPAFLLKKEDEAASVWPSDVKPTVQTPETKPEQKPEIVRVTAETKPETKPEAPAPQPAQPKPQPAPQPTPQKDAAFSSERLTSPVSPVPPPKANDLSPIEARTREALSKMWQWLIVGEEYRPGGSTKEYAVATTWMLRSAVLLLVLGIAYFIKYSHERNLLPPELRLSIAVVFALAIIAAGCKLLNGKKYRVIGTTLAGVGFAGLYLCVFASVSIYHLLDVWVGLAGMIVLTAAGAALALRFDSMFLAMLAVCGGFLAPILMNTGSRNLAGLFGYMTVLVAGSLVVARRRSWQALNILAFLFTWVIYIAAKPFPHSTGPHTYVEPLAASTQWASIGAVVNRAYFIAAGFAVVFFLAFCLQTVAYNLFTRRKVSLLELSFAALNGIVFLSVTLPPTILIYGREYAAIITFAGAIVYLMQVSLLLKAKMEDRALLLTLLVFSCGLIALTFPLLLKQDHLAVAWSVQAAAMLYIACRTRSVILARLSYVVYMIAAVRLLGFDLTHGYFRHSQEFWTRLTNFGSYTAALAGGFFMLKRYAAELHAGAAGEGSVGRYPKSSKVMFWCMYCVSFIMIAGEFTYWEHLKISGVVAAGALYLLILALIPKLFRENTRGIVNVGALLLIIYLGFLFVVCISHPRGGASAQAVLWRLFPNLWSVVILALAGMFFGRLALEADTKDSVAASARSTASFFLVSAMAFWFVYSSDELYYLVQHYSSAGGARIAVSLLWGFYALMMLAFGILRAKKPFRIAALILFAVTVLKIFFYDLAGTPAIYRIAGCMVTGAALIAGAWLYARFEQKGDSSDEPRS